MKKSFKKLFLRLLCVIPNECSFRRIDRWNEVSDLDRHALLQKLKSKDWDEKTIEEIKKYLITKEEKRIYPSKLRPQDLK